VWLPRIKAKAAKRRQEEQQQQKQETQRQATRTADPEFGSFERFTKGALLLVCLRPMAKPSAHAAPLKVCRAPTFLLGQ